VKCETSYSFLKKHLKNKYKKRHTHTHTQKEKAFDDFFFSQTNELRFVLPSGKIFTGSFGKTNIAKQRHQAQKLL
jgi:hypothetical protein